MGGKDNPSPNVLPQLNNAGLQNINAGQQLQSNPQLQSLLTKYGTGGMSYNDVVNAIQGMSFASPENDQSKAAIQSQLSSLAQQGKIPLQVANGGNTTNWGNTSPADQAQAQGLLNQLTGIPSTSNLSAQALQQLLTNPLTASKVASDQALSNPALSGMFSGGPSGTGMLGQLQQSYTDYGQKANDLYSTFGGLSSNLDSDRQALMGNDQSYGLTPEDLAAYGQGSANIARQFAGAGDAMAQSLASRGLSAAPNGATPASFSTLYGNQNEQLAQLQTTMAQNRISTAQGLAQARTKADLDRQAQAQQLYGQIGTLQQGAATNAKGLSDLGEQAISNQYGMNTGSATNQFNSSLAANNANMGNWAADQNAVNNSISAYNQANPSTSIWDTIGNVTGGVKNVAGAVGSVM